jgi:hypothetical protein
MGYWLISFHSNFDERQKEVQQWRIGRIKAKNQ